MASESYVRAHSQLIDLAKAMLDGRKDLIVGCQEIHGLAHFFPDQWSILSFFVAVASETDHWPLEHARLNCAPGYLKRVDREIEDYLSEMRPGIERVCADVLRLFEVDNPK